MTLTAHCDAHGKNTKTVVRASTQTSCSKFTQALLCYKIKKVSIDITQYLNNYKHEKGRGLHYVGPIVQKLFGTVTKVRHLVC